ncbi:hypothetical protein MY4824_002928 [Beauveria thailandica]
MLRRQAFERDPRLNTRLVCTNLIAAIQQLEYLAPMFSYRGPRFMSVQVFAGAALARPGAVINGPQNSIGNVEATSWRQSVMREIFLFQKSRGVIVVRGSYQYDEAPSENLALPEDSGVARVAKAGDFTVNANSFCDAFWLPIPKYQSPSLGTGD